MLLERKKEKQQKQKGIGNVMLCAKAKVRPSRGTKVKMSHPIQAVAFSPCVHFYALRYHIDHVIYQEAVSVPEVA